MRSIAFLAILSMLFGAPVAADTGETIAHSFIDRMNNYTATQNFIAMKELLDEKFMFHGCKLYFEAKDLVMFIYENGPFELEYISSRKYISFMEIVVKIHYKGETYEAMLRLRPDYYKGWPMTFGRITNCRSY